jgi:hypothetical protein
MLGPGAAGLTAVKMKDCHWLKPLLVGQFECVAVLPWFTLSVDFCFLDSGCEAQSLQV